MDDIAACIEHLRQREEVVHAGIGFVGFCMGGKLAYLAATRTDVSCSVGYYGMGIEALLDEAKQIKGRLVLHFAEQDAYCPQQARDAILPACATCPRPSCTSTPASITPSPASAACTSTSRPT